MPNCLRKIIALVFFTVIFAYPISVHALTVSPLHYKLSIDKGGSQTISIIATNNNSKKRYFKIKVIGVKEDQSGRPKFGDGFDPAEAWIKPELVSFSLASDERKTIKVIISAPFDAQSGSHYAALAVEEDKDANSQVALSARAAILLSIDVAGSVEENIVVEQWQSQKAVLTQKKWPFILVLKNNGTMTLPLTGTLEIRNMFGSAVDNQPVYLGSNLLVQSYRQLKPTVVANVLWPGMYQAQIKVNYGLSQTQASALTTVWYFPWWSIVALVIAVCLSLWLYYYMHIMTRKK